MSPDEAPISIDLAREPRFALGGADVRPATRELVAGERREVLEPRVMQVLVALARRRGEVVSRDELIASCWGGRVVGEDAIQRCIAAIRRLADACGGFSVETFARVGYRLSVSQQAQESLSSAPEPVLAVLPFDNLSGDPEMAYFSDGISEEIQQTVARIAGLKVIGRTSSFQFRADKATARVAAALRATHILDGSVRRAGERVRVAAQLVGCATETALWSDRFDRELSDVFALQDEIAAAVAAALEAVFAPQAPVTRIDPAMYDLFLRAQASEAIVDPEKTREAIGMLEEVVAAAPRFARAWGHLAVERALALRRAGKDLPDYRQERAAVKEAAATALKLDPRSASAFLALIWLEPFAAYKAREALIQKALRAAPNDPAVLTMMAWFLCQVGRCREALDFATRAYELDPLRPEVAYAYASLLRNYERSRDLWRTLYQRWPDNDAIAYSAMAAAHHNRDQEWYDHLVRTSGSRLQTPVFEALIWFLQNLGNPDWQAINERFENETLAMLKRNGTLPLERVTSTHRIGLRDEAFELVEQASFAHMFDETGPPPSAGPTAGRSSGGADVIFRETNTMVADIRFVGFCAKLGLCDYWVESGHWPDCAEDGSLTYDFKAEARRLIGAA